MIKVKSGLILVAMLILVPATLAAYDYTQDDIASSAIDFSGKFIIEIFMWIRFIIIIYVLGLSAKYLIQKWRGKG